MVPNDTGRNICLLVGGISSESTSAILRVFEDYTYEIVCSLATVTVMPPLTLEIDWQDYIINPEIEMLPVKYRKAGQCGDIISRSGKIVSLWNSQTSKWVVWYEPKQIEPVRIMQNKFIRRFRGNNRGRHFDRKFKP